MESPLLQQGLALVKEAVVADNAGEYQQALDIYIRSFQFFLHEIKHSKQDIVKVVLRDRVAAYMARAEEIKAALATGMKPNSGPGASTEAAAMGTGSTGRNDKTQICEDAKDEEFDLKRSLADRVGLESVKNQMLELEHQLALDKRRHEVNPSLPRTKFPHLLFRGPPGCGKTSMARLIARVLRNLGILNKGHLVEVQRSDLVAGHIGQTALKTREVIESAKGGVLFVDECYRLSHGITNDFGPEAVHEIMSAMEEGDPCMIFAGYDDADMDHFVETNPGLYRRIHQVFTFPSFTTDELAKILMIKVEESGYKLAPTLQCVDAIVNILESHTSLEQRTRMNGGIADHILRNAKRHLDARLDVDVPVEQLLVYEINDLVRACGDVPTPPGEACTTNTALTSGTGSYHSTRSSVASASRISSMDKRSSELTPALVLKPL